MALKRAPAPPAPSAVLAALDARLNELRERRKRATAEIIRLEAAGAVAAPSEKEVAPRVHADALALLAGDDAAPAPVEPSIHVQCWRLHRLRETIDAALTLGEQQIFRARVEARGKIAKDIEEAWAANVAATCALLLQLDELAAARERLASEFCTRTGLQPDLLACLGHARAAAPGPIVGNAPYRLIQEAKRTKLID